MPLMATRIKLSIGQRVHCDRCLVRPKFSRWLGAFYLPLVVLGLIEIPALLTLAVVFAYWWVIALAKGKPVSTIWVILYQVSYIRRP